MLSSLYENPGIINVELVEHKSNQPEPGDIVYSYGEFIVVPQENQLHVGYGTNDNFPWSDVNAELD